MRAVVGGMLFGLLALAGCKPSCPQGTHADDGRCVPGHAVESMVANNQAEPGFLVVVCNPGCEEVFDNGKSLGKSPVVKVPVKAGGHHLELHAGAVKKELDVEVKPGETRAERVAMESP